MQDAAQAIVGKSMVVGFCFTESRSHVVLILKNKPAWQKGMLNGVGGKIEPNESQWDAIKREWLEETGVIIVPNWRSFCEMRHGPNHVTFFEMTVPTMFDIPVKPAGEEQAAWHSTWNVINGIHPMVKNLKWLIPLACDGNLVDATVLDRTMVQC